MLEFQSEVDFLMPLRIRHCVDSLHMEGWRDRRFRSTDGLAPVLPGVLYTGTAPKKRRMPARAVPEVHWALLCLQELPVEPVVGGLQVRTEHRGGPFEILPFARAQDSLVLRDALVDQLR